MDFRNFCNKNSSKKLTLEKQSKPPLLMIPIPTPTTTLPFRTGKKTPKPLLVTRTGEKTPKTLCAIPPQETTTPCTSEKSIDETWGCWVLDEAYNQNDFDIPSSPLCSLEEELSVFEFADLPPIFFEDPCLGVDSDWDRLFFKKTRVEQLLPQKTSADPVLCDWCQNLLKCPEEIEYSNKRKTRPRRKAAEKASNKIQKIASDDRGKPPDFCDPNNPDYYFF